MENLLLNQTEETPSINFNLNGELFIKGVSIPENIANFYAPVMSWLNNFELYLPDVVTLTFEIEYLNTSSTRVVLDIIKKVNSYKVKCPQTKIIWKYIKDDDDNFDLGKDLEYSAKANFIFETL